MITRGGNGGAAGFSYIARHFTHYNHNVFVFMFFKLSALLTSHSAN